MKRRQGKQSPPQPVNVISTEVFDFFRELAKKWAPNPELTISQWADRYRVLTTATSAEPGNWNTDRAVYQREIMDSLNDPEVQEIAIMASAQVGKTDMSLNMIGYYIDNDPSPIMYVLPTDKLVESFSKERLQEMIDASPQLRGRVGEAKGRDGGNTISEKKFPGGYIAIVGANSPSDLSSRPIKVLLCDEVDRYPVSAGKEGDPITLATRRTTTFGYQRKHVFVSTPTLKETSRIEKLYEDSTAEEFCLSCPSCGEFQPIKWGQVKFEYRKEEDGDFTVTSVEHACRKCGALHSEKEWKKAAGKWIARKKHAFRRGFHLNQFVSPWVRWDNIVREFLEANRDGTEMLKAWTNTVLGESWEEEGEKLEHEILFERLEEYAAEVPDEVKVLTAGVDVQDDRFEIEVIGWGAGKESWGIDYHVIYGNLRHTDVWSRLSEYLTRSFARADGSRVPISITCMDSGGHFTTEVYRFCAIHKSRKVYAIKGQGGINGQYVPLISSHKVTPREGAIMFMLGVDEGKNKIFTDLKVQYPGPGFCHFPKGRGYGLDYFKGLTAERRQLRKRMGVGYFEWVKIRDRNEPFDLRVYNLAALEVLNPRLDDPTLNFRQVSDALPDPQPPKPAAHRPMVSKRSSIW